MKPHEKEQQSDADGNGRIGDVEGGPVVSEAVHVDKINDFPEADAIDEVAHGSGKDEGQGKNKVLLIPWKVVKVPQNSQAGDQGYNDEKRLSETAVGEKTESGSLVADRGDIQEVRNDIDAFVQGKVFFDINFG